MPENRYSRTGVARGRCAPHPEYEVRYWTERLGVSEDEVHAAVKRIRLMVQDERQGVRK